MIPCQVSGQAVATKFSKLVQASGVAGPETAGAGGVGPSAACATPAIALMTTKASTDFFTVTLLPRGTRGVPDEAALYSAEYNTDNYRLSSIDASSL